jgi:aryl sulfotransferase
MIRYRDPFWDNARWEGFEHRPGDIVISTPPKSGTTWTQMLCALLIFDGAEFPAPLGEISPWLDLLVRPIAEVRAIYAAQRHRRFIKTHTPLDGLPLRKDVTYLVVGRDPRDVAISMEHHVANVDLGRILELRARAVGADEQSPPSPPPPASEDPAERLRAFVEARPESPGANLESVLHHLSTGWERRSEPNVALFHYADYRADLPGELLRLADALGTELSAARAADLAAEASLERMRERADDVVPEASLDQWKDTRAFLRAGASGEWKNRASAADRARYDERVAALAPPDLAAWAHRGRRGSGIDPRSA